MTYLITYTNDYQQITNEIPKFIFIQSEKSQSEVVEVKSVVVLTDELENV